MFKTFAVALFAAAAMGLGAAHATDISGAGSTFAAPIYAKWAEAYKSAAKSSVNYQGIGSGGGIKQIEAKTVDFGASDKPLKPADLDANGLLQFPTVIGGVVPVMNLPGVGPGQIKLTGEVLALIFLGDIRTWGDPRIAALNPGVNLPRLPITVVHRSDGSGTSFVFTTYLANHSAVWAKKVGANDAVEWPVGLGGKGNDGVAAFVKQTIGSIGYVEYAFAQQKKMISVTMKNAAGAFVVAAAPAFASAAAAADWNKAPGNYLLLLDQPGAGSWPITGATFALVHKTQNKPAQGRQVLAFFDWAYANGDAAALQLGYVPLPAPVKVAMRKQWASVKGVDGKAVYVAK
jgi:phosphate transport system substrate-binding protein